MAQSAVLAARLAGQAQAFGPPNFRAIDLFGLSFSDMPSGMLSSILSGDTGRHHLFLERAATGAGGPLQRVQRMVREQQAQMD
jgi:hypothetical protein